MASQYYKPLSNGLQSFADASPEYEFADVGIGSFREQAGRLAEFGRNGDIYVVHAAEGETVIPTEVLDANPKVRELLFEQMRGMGLDPQEYVVGNELNSRNPVTGMPEFFFRSIFDSVKKAVKKVGEAAKEWAPLVLPMAASMFGVPFLGPAFGAGTFGAAFLGSGIGSLVSGASVKDSIKSGLIAGATVSATSALTQGASKTGTAMGGLEGSFSGKTPVFQAGNYDTPVGYQYAASPFAKSKYSLNIGGYGTDGLAAAQRASDAQWGWLGSGEADKGLGPLSGTFLDPTVSVERPGFVSSLDGGGGGGGKPTAPDLPKTNEEIAALRRVPPPPPPQRQAQFSPPNRPFPRLDLPKAPAFPTPEERAALNELLAASPTQDALSRRQAYNRALTPTNKFAPYNVREPSFLHADRLLAESYDPARPGTDVRRFTGPSTAPPPPPKKAVLQTTTPPPTGVKPGDRTWSRIAQQGSPFADPSHTIKSGPNTGNVLYGAEAEIAAGAAGRNAWNAANPQLVGTDAGLKGAAAAARRAIAGTAPTYTQQYALPVLGGLAAYAALNDDEDDKKRELASLEKQRNQKNPLLVTNPGDYLVSDLGSRQYSTRGAADLVVPTTYPYQMRANQGGLAQYPRREMLVEGPGTERSDDIPAMLSDGEFVLNARSVRGADPTGQGNRHRGAQNLYRMMRDFEMRV